MVAAYSLRQSKNCVKRLGQFVLNFVFICFTFSIPFRETSNQEKESMIGAVLRDMSIYKIFTLLDTTSRTFRLCDRSILTSLLLPVFCGFPFSPRALSQKSWTFSGLFRMPQFPLYFRNAGVLIHETSQSFRNVLRHQLFKTSGLYRNWVGKFLETFEKQAPVDSTNRHSIWFKLICCLFNQ